MSKELKIVAIQTNVIWQNAAENRGSFEQKISQLDTDTA